MKLVQYKIDQANALARALYTILKTASTEEYYGKTLEDILLDKRLNIAKTSNLYRVCNFLTSRLQHVRRLPSNQSTRSYCKRYLLLYSSDAGL